MQGPFDSVSVKTLKIAYLEISDQTISSEQATKRNLYNILKLVSIEFSKLDYITEHKTMRLIKANLYSRI